jgi:hypothetical protein
MKNIIGFTVCICTLLVMSASAYQTNFYVDVNSPIDGPGTGWSNAFHTIQQGIDAFQGGRANVLVNDGVYEVGETVVQNSQIKNRVYIPWEYMTVRSVNGPEVTIIKGQGPVGDNAVRCVAILNSEYPVGCGAVLSGFTLTDGHTMTTTYPNNRGAGVFCYATNSVIENCIISNCVSDFRGGGAYSGILNNCKTVNNTAGEGGGGAYKSTLNNCTIAENTSTVGVWDSTLNNCIVWNNTYSEQINEQNWEGSTFNYCCVLPEPANGVGNITNNPQFVSNDYRLATSSPCMDSGDNSYAIRDTDLDGNQRIYDGNRDGNAIVDMGCYESIIKNTWYVNDTSPQSSSGTSWDTAFYNIQSAISAALDNDTVLVTNGTYASSGLTVHGTLGNRVAINKAITVKSVNGPDVTIIKGYGGINGDDARRCAYVGTNAVLSGFTLREGHTRTSGIISDKNGGGAWCEDDGTISNCIITENTAYSEGGGVYKGTISRCTISSNSASTGGGAYFGTLDNCLLFGNEASNDGGGGYRGTYYNCTISSNSAGMGGGVYNPTAYNSIIWNNTAADDEYMNWAYGDFYYSCTTPLPSGTGNISSTPDFGRGGAKQFAPYRSSSCIDSGNNDDVVSLYAIDGTPRILDSNDDGTVIVDMGCYETIDNYADSDSDGMPDGWESDYGLNPADASDADKTADADAASNLAEYIADTDPTDSNSYFSVTSFVKEQYAILYFESTGFRYYTLQSCTNLTNDSWADVPGQGPFKGSGLSLGDTNPPTMGAYYRVKVSVP